MITTILLVIALIAFLLAAIDVSSRINLVALGLAMLTLIMLIGAMPVHLG